jgi:hypothetical protein
VAVFYVVYVEVEADAAAEWEAYMRGHHIQEVVDTGCFTGAIFASLDEAPEGKRCFRTIYTADDKAALDRYFATFAAGLRDDHNRRFGSRVSARREVLEVISRFAPLAPVTGE